MKPFLFIAFVIFSLASCQSNQSSKPLNQAGSSNHEVIVKEVIQVRGYTYLRVEENQSELWIATPPVNAKEGERFYYEGGFVMTNFKSKELNRTFENILFLEGISAEPIEPENPNAMISPGASTIKEGKKDIKISPIEGGITIADLYSNKDSYSGKMVKIKGEVTKFSPEIMETNWIHIQDGTESDGFFDLTINSKEIVKTGDIVIFEGKVILDKDLGYGYFFEILIEDARVIK